MKQLIINMSKCKGGQSCSHECEHACATKVFKLVDRASAAININTSPDEENPVVICNQCGDCMAVCPADALKRNKLGVVIVDKKLCVGCYMCIGFCEKNAFKRSPIFFEPYKCISCGICVKVCPNNALEIIDVPIPTTRII